MISALLIEATSDTPRIIIDPENLTFIISGRSLPENAIEFYKPIIDKLNEYLTSPLEKTTFDIKLEYFNTASAKQIAKLLLILEKLSLEKQVFVKWYYSKEDTDMLSSGKRYDKLIKINFEFIEE